MILLLSFFWYIRTARALFFTLYLWQLKEYHIGRFLAHFRTAKGKRLLFHPFVAAKLALLVLWFFQPVTAAFLLLVLYIGETILFFRAANTKTLLFPVLTRKTTVLMFSLLFLQSVFLAGTLLYILDSPFLALLLFDVLSLLIGSLVVLLWQPYTIFERSRVLRRATQKRAKLKNLKVVGITGSYGKTSTKEFLAHILGKKFIVLKTPEHKNSEMGIAHTILYNLTDEHQVFVCEMGAYSKGGIKLLANMAKPTIGIVTGVNEQHLGVFGSEMSLFSAEGGGELVQSLPQEGVLILNDDSRQLHELGPWLQLWNPNFANYVWCSAKTQKDFFARDVVVAKDQVSFTMAGKNEKEAKVVLPLVGKHNVENVLLAAATAEVLGMSIQEIAEALRDVPAEVGVMLLKKGKQGIEILDSSYSANPTGVFAALEHIKLWEGKKIMVMPSLIELGSASSTLHVQIGRKIGEVCDMAIITTQDEFPALLKGAKEKGMKEKDMFLSENPKEIAEKILKIAKKEDVVLLEGRIPAGILPLLEV
ncbi:UDP-N-acetylmuramoyl-tripeptide--D-alanyl-D-alanine ligase [Patescibacteria group bacterium]|nr:UDP-N-acetylmuramoyl-tripeptide--D-alanyl-D-alanine ligase [Patescibacteria group bacterium]